MFAPARKLANSLTRPFLDLIFSLNYPKHLLGIFVLWFGVWAISLSHPQDFVLEHILTVVSIALLWGTHRRFRLSNLSYSLIFAFLSLHVVGAH